MKFELQTLKGSYTQGLAAIPFLTAAGIGSVGAQEVAPGQWTGGDPATETPFYMCLHVSEDGKRLTAVGTKCLGDQGTDSNSIDIEWQSGVTPEGFNCNQNSYRGAAQGDVEIGADGSFTHTFRNAVVDTTVSGKFEGDTVSGSARTVVNTGFFNIDCSVEWSATPAVAGPPDTVSPPTVTPESPPLGSTAPAGIAPGQWAGGIAGSNDPFYVCLNVSADGQKLTSVGTQCRGNQGQNPNSIDLQFQGGLTPTGERCNQNVYRGEDLGDLQIGPDGSFTHTFSNAFVNTILTGTFDPNTQTASGSARAANPWIDCSVNWTARPIPTSSP